MNTYFPDALKNLCPNSNFLIRGEYILSNVEWVKLADPIPTNEQIELEEKRLEQFYGKKLCKQQAKQLIASCDWAVLPDVNIQNKTEFENYRATLRDLIFNPVANPEWPVEPTPILIKQGT